jgi:acetoin:2,6-dichlorophenolindophenol oxidoreductase subunit alpha
VAAARETCPIEEAARRFIAAGGSATALAALRASAASEINAASQAAARAPWPDAAAAFTDVQNTGTGRWF